MSKIKRKCLICNSIFFCPSFEIKKGYGKYCSRKCKFISQKDKNVSKKFREQRMKNLSKTWGNWKGKKHKPETKKLFSEIQRGKFKEQARSWKGGRRIGTGGYMYILTDEKRIFSNGVYKNKYQPEHRYIMEKHLGRKLQRHEIIHHKNGIKTDNRLENLEILTLKTHMGKVTCPHCLKEFLIK